MINVTREIPFHPAHQGWNWLKMLLVRPVNGPVGIICSTGEIPANTGEKVTNFLENNF
jgi:hypothetical protein